MGLLATAKQGADFQPCPEDMYNAVCIGVYDLGIQKTNFGNKHQVFLEWELDYEKSDGSRFVVGRKYTPSLHEKATFRHMLEAWSGRKCTSQEEKEGFDVLKLLGKPCQVQVVHSGKDGKVYANVNNVTKLGKGMTPLQPSKPLLSFTFDDNGRNIPPEVSPWIVKQIQSSINWIEPQNMGKQPQFSPDENPEDVPF